MGWAARRHLKTSYESHHRYIFFVFVSFVAQLECGGVSLLTFFALHPCPPFGIPSSDPDYSPATPNTWSHFCVPLPLPQSRKDLQEAYEKRQADIEGKLQETVASYMPLLEELADLATTLDVLSAYATRVPGEVAGICPVPFFGCVFSVWCFYSICAHIYVYIYIYAHI